MAYPLISYLITLAERPGFVRPLSALGHVPTRPVQAVTRGYD